MHITTEMIERERSEGAERENMHTETIEWDDDKDERDDDRDNGVRENRQ